MYGLEAVEVGFRKLVAVSVRKVGGIRMLVVARMPPLPWLGWFFLHLEEGGLPYASTARLICFLFLRQGIRCHRCHGPREASFFQGTPLLLLLVDFLAPRSMWVVVAWLILFVVFVARQQPWPLLHAATMLIVFFFSWNSTMARSLLPLTCSLLHGQCLLCSGAKKFWLIFWLLQSPVICQF